jgi:hypothetical protein
MKSKFIKITNVADVPKFVAQAAAVDGDVICKKGRYIVDGGSILGVMSFDTSTGMTVEYPEAATAFEKYISQFEAKEVG